jgi:hypothetical protein
VWLLPEKLFQPYLSLLELNYAVDDFLIAIKKRESDVLRGEASNAVPPAPKAAKRRKRRNRRFGRPIECDDLLPAAEASD